MNECTSVPAERLDRVWLSAQKWEPYILRSLSLCAMLGSSVSEYAALILAKKMRTRRSYDDAAFAHGTIYKWIVFTIDERVYVLFVTPGAISCSAPERGADWDMLASGNVLVASPCSCPIPDGRQSTGGAPLVMARTPPAYKRFCFFEPNQGSFSDHTLFRSTLSRGKGVMVGFYLSLTFGR